MKKTSNASVSRDASLIIEPVAIRPGAAHQSKRGSQKSCAVLPTAKQRQRAHATTPEAAARRNPPRELEGASAARETAEPPDAAAACLEETTNPPEATT